MREDDIIMDKIKMHKEYCQLLNDTYTKKNADYGDSFGKTYRELGIISAITRINDKFNRLVSLARKPNNQQVLDESIADTLLDMANYAIMTAIELQLEYDSKLNNKDGV